MYLIKDNKNDSVNRKRKDGQGDAKYGQTIKNDVGVFIDACTCGGVHI